MIEPISAVEPKCLLTLTEWGRVNITIDDNNAIFLASGTNGKQDLLTGILGVLGGHKVDKTHPFQDWFIGELWAIASVDNTLANVMVSSPIKSQSRFDNPRLPRAG